MNDTTQAIVAAIQVCCEEEGWKLLDVSVLNPKQPQFKIRIGLWTGTFGCETDVIEPQISDEDATMIAITFRDAVYATLVHYNIDTGEREMLQ